MKIVKALTAHRFVIVIFVMGVSAFDVLIGLLVLFCSDNLRR